MTQTPWVALVGCLAATLLASSGCSGSSDGHQRAQEDADRQRALDEWESLTPEEQTEEREDVEADRNAFMDQCMSEEGFEWTPPPPAPSEVDFPSPDEFRESFGFGISTTIGSTDERVSPPPPPAPMPGDASSDVTTPDQAGLSPEELTAYRDREMACTLEAPQLPFEEVTEGEGGGMPIEEVEQEVQSDPRVIDAQRRWSRCMSDGGFDAASPQELVDDITSRAEPFVSEYQEAHGESLAESSNASPPDPAAVFSAGELAELTSLQQYELEAAAADHECGEELSRVIDEVWAEIEGEYVEGG
jgi:hypothetical protein